MQGNLGFDWLPDETVYSLSGRYHRLSSNPTPAQTARQLFGAARRGYQHDLPSGIRCLATNAGGRLGAPREIIRDHTILPFYLPFRASRDAKDAYSTMQGSSIGGLKMRLGIVTSRFRANHPLRACAACLVDDRRQHHVAYWHRSHQLPGVYICPVHAKILLESDLKSTGVARFDWVLPDSRHLHPVQAVGGHSVDAGLTVAALQHLSEVSIALVGLPDGFHFDHGRLLSAYRRALDQQGLLTSGGSLRLAEIKAAFARAAKPLATVGDLAALFGHSNDDGGQVASVLRGLRGGTHPLRHLAIIVWLFESWARFWEAYGTKPHETEVPRKSPQRQLTDDRRAAFLRLLRGGASISGAARQVGADVGTGQAWAAAAGFQTPRRPKSMSPVTYRAIIRDLRRGREKAEVASARNVSVQTITRLLRTVVGLHLEWAEAKQALDLKANRSEFARALRKVGTAGAKVVRMHARAAYAWLYRNDRPWLVQQLSLLPALAGGNHSRTNWDERDARLAAQIRKAALTIRQEGKAGQSIPLWRIYQVVPELKAKLAALSRMPLTQRALRETAGYRRRQRSQARLF